MKKYFHLGHGHSHGGHSHDKHHMFPALEEVLSEGDINDNKGNFQVPVPDSKVPPQTECTPKKECKWICICSVVYTKFHNRLYNRFFESLLIIALNHKKT